MGQTNNLAMLHCELAHTTTQVDFVYNINPDDTSNVSGSFVITNQI